MPQEEMRDVNGGVVIATLRGGNDVMEDDTADVEGKEVSYSAIGYITDKGT